MYINAVNTDPIDDDDDNDNTGAIIGGIIGGIVFLVVISAIIVIIVIWWRNYRNQNDNGGKDYNIATVYTHKYLMFVHTFCTSVH